jgi:VHL beta domain
MKVVVMRVSNKQLNQHFTESHSMYFKILSLAFVLMSTNTSFAVESKCGSERQLRSIVGDTPTHVKFTNRSKSTRLIYWIDYDGSRVFYNTLKPNQTYTQQTYVTHPWVTTTRSGNCTGIHFPKRYTTHFSIN